MAASGSLIALPSWAREWSADDIALTSTSSFTPVEQALIGSLTDTIIPAGNSIGANSVGVDKFVQKLIDDCYEKEVQENVKVQLAALDATAQRVHKKAFPACDQAQRQDLFVRLSTSEKKEEKDFFELVKSETIRGFNTSREVMLDYLHYKVVPGHYHGCVDVTA